MDGNLPRRYHIQCSRFAPEFYHDGTKESIAIRGAPQKEEFIRHWLQAIQEHLTHFMDIDFSILVRTVSNKTPTYSERARPGDRTQWLSEVIAKVHCKSINYKEDEQISNRVRQIFNLTGSHQFHRSLTLQGLHYEIIPSAANNCTNRSQFKNILLHTNDP
jgi:hypothetical protein